MTQQEALAQAMNAVLGPEPQVTDAEAAAILATPQMQAIARQAAIGAAVERFHERFGCWYLEWNDTVSVGTQGYKHSKPTVRAKARNIPAAIAAALGEDDD